MNTPRDGVWTASGLSADFRFVAPAAGGIKMSWVATVSGEFCAPDDQLTYDPVRDLTPEAAAVVAASGEADMKHWLDIEEVYQEDHWQIWTPDTTGGILGSGKTLHDALADALANMEVLCAEIRVELTPKAGSD